ncbi:hypothetical protein TomMM35A_16560 [Sphingobium sp. TomMM35A]
MTDRAQTRQFQSRRFNYVSATIGRAIIYDYNLKAIDTKLLTQQRIQCPYSPFDSVNLVEAGNYESERYRIARISFYAKVMRPRGYSAASLGRRNVRHRA